ncbi:hypothetical protein [Streptomyces sp. NPDC054838]
MPFGAGSRKCIGDSCGLTKTVLALASITAQWRLSALPGHRMRPAAASLPRLRTCMASYGVIGSGRRRALEDCVMA